MKTEFREEDQNYVMTFEGRLDTLASRQVERDSKCSTTVRAMISYSTAPIWNTSQAAVCVSFSIC